MAISTNLSVYFRCSGSLSTTGNFTGSFTDVSTTASGKYGSGWSMDSDTAYITVGPKIQATGSAGYSVALWAYDFGRDYTSGESALFARSFDGAVLFSRGWGSGRKLGLRTDGGTQVFFQGTSSGTDLIWPIASFNDVWTHLAVTVANQTASLYINNSLVATSENSNWDDTQLFDTIGNMQPGFGGRVALARRLDEIALWTRALNSSEITQIYGSEINSLISGGGSSVSKQRSAQLRAETQLNNATSSAGGDGFLLKADGTVRVASEFTVNKPRQMVYAGYIAERLNTIVGSPDSLSGSIAFAGTNYINAATDITGALKLLDGAISGAEGVEPVTGSAGGRDFVKITRSATVDAYATKAANVAALNRYFAGYTTVSIPTAVQLAAGVAPLSVPVGLQTGAIAIISDRLDRIANSGSAFGGIGGASLVGNRTMGSSLAPSGVVAGAPFGLTASPLDGHISLLASAIGDLRSITAASDLGIPGDLGIGHQAYTATYTPGVYSLASGSVGVAINAALDRIDILSDDAGSTRGSARIGHNAGTVTTGSFQLADSTLRAAMTSLNSQFGVLQSREAGAVGSNLVGYNGATSGSFTIASNTVSTALDEIVARFGVLGSQENALGSNLVGYQGQSADATRVARLGAAAVKDTFDTLSDYLYLAAGNASLVRKADHLKVQYQTTGAVGSQYDLALGADIHDSASVQVFVNGLLQRHGAGRDWTMSGDNTVRVQKGLETGDFLVVQFMRKTSQS